MRALRAGRRDQDTGQDADCRARLVGSDLATGGDAGPSKKPFRLRGTHVELSRPRERSNARVHVGRTYSRSRSSRDSIHEHEPSLGASREASKGIHAGFVIALGLLGATKALSIDVRYRT